MTTPLGGATVRALADVIEAERKASAQSVADEKAQLDSATQGIGVLLAAALALSLAVAFAKVRTVDRRTSGALLAMQRAGRRRPGPAGG